MIFKLQLYNKMMDRINDLNTESNMNQIDICVEYYDYQFQQPEKKKEPKRTRSKTVTKNKNKI